MADDVAGVTTRAKRNRKLRPTQKEAGEGTAQATQTAIQLPDETRRPDPVDINRPDVLELPRSALPPAVTSELADKPSREEVPPALVSPLPFDPSDKPAHQDTHPVQTDGVQNPHARAEPPTSDPLPPVHPDDKPTHDEVRQVDDGVAKPYVPVPPPLIEPEDAVRHETFRAAPDSHVREKLSPWHLRRKPFYTDMPDKGLFVGFAVCGFLAILITKMTGFPGFLTAIGALVLLVTYAYLAFRLDRFKANPDSLGDNCYYMGFLFTLASLSAALVALERETASGRVDLLEALIGSFGVALFSTIGGITLRVFFMQMRREIVDVEEQMRTDLQNSANLLKDQLAKAIGDLENVRIRTTQVLEQQTNDAASGFSRVAEQLVGYVSSASSAYNSASERADSNASRPPIPT